MSNINSPKKKISRSDSLFSSRDRMKSVEKQKEREKEIQKEKEKEKETNKLIKNVLSINLAELKETIHKEYLQFQHRINDSIQSYSQKLKNISACEKRLIEQMTEVKLKADKAENNFDKLFQMEDKITTFEIRLNNLIREYRSSCTKYDSLFIDNMTVPGKIGNYCKYKNIKEFLSYAFNKFSELDLVKENFEAKIKNNQEKVDKFIRKINIEMDILREESMQVTTKKITITEKKLTNEIEEINKKIASIPNSILYSDLERRMSELTDNFNNIKNIKEEIDTKLTNIDNDIDSFKEKFKEYNKIIKKKSIDKKDTKVTFSSLSNSKFIHSKRNEPGDLTSKNSISSSNSSKNINKYFSFNLNKTNYNKNNKNNKNMNLNNKNEEFEENNNISPINNMRIKSINYTDSKFKSNTSLSEKLLINYENNNNNKNNNNENKNDNNIKDNNKTEIVNKKKIKQFSSFHSYNDSSEEIENIIGINIKYHFIKNYI